MLPVDRFRWQPRSGAVTGTETSRGFLDERRKGEGVGERKGKKQNGGNNYGGITITTGGMQRFNKSRAFSSGRIGAVHLDAATAPFSRSGSRDPTRMIPLVSSLARERCAGNRGATAV